MGCLASSAPDSIPNNGGLTTAMNTDTQTAAPLDGLTLSLYCGHLRFRTAESFHLLFSYCCPINFGRPRIYIGGEFWV